MSVTENSDYIKRQKPLINIIMEQVRTDLANSGLEKRSTELWDSSAAYMEQLPNLEELWTQLKKIKLKDCLISIPTQAEEGPPYFLITDSTNDKSIPFSNRYGKMELRGSRLREALNDRITTSDNETLFDALSYISTHQFTTTEVNRETATKAEEYCIYTVTSMSDMHYTLFTTAVRQELLQSKDPNTAKIDEIAIYQKTEQLASTIENNIGLLKDKQENLGKRNAKHAEGMLEIINKQLALEKSDLISGKITLPQFFKNCEKHIENAEKNEVLQGHRGTWGKLSATASKILKTTPLATDTTKKIEQFKKTLNNLKESAEKTSLTKEEEPPSMRIK